MNVDFGSNVGRRGGTIREYSEFDANGELLFNTVTRRPIRRKGWIMMFTAQMRKLLGDTALTAADLRVLLALTSLQTHSQPFVTTTRQKLADVTKLSLKSISRAYTALEKANYIKVFTNDFGYRAVCINPALITTASTSALAHAELWRQLCEDEGTPGPKQKIIDPETGEILDNGEEL